MLFDEDRVRRLAGELRRAVARLKELGEFPKTEFLADPHRVASAKYHFIVGIEAAVDLGNHIISKNSLGVPDDYGHIFRILGEAGVVPQDFAAALTNMARFRNRLVHIYWWTRRRCTACSRQGWPTWRGSYCSCGRAWAPPLRVSALKGCRRRRARPNRK